MADNTNNTNTGNSKNSQATNSTPVQQNNTNVNDNLKNAIATQNTNSKNTTTKDTNINQSAKTLAPLVTVLQSIKDLLKQYFTNTNKKTDEQNKKIAEVLNKILNKLETANAATPTITSNNTNSVLIKKIEDTAIDDNMLKKYMREFITQFDSTYFSAMKTRMDSINTSLETLINNSNNSNNTVDTNTNKELTELVKVYSDTQNTQLNTILEKFNIVESNLTNINETLNIKVANNTSDSNLNLFDTSILNNIDNNIQTFVTDFNKWTVTNGNTLANILNIIDNYAQTEIDKLTENNYLTSQIFNTVDSTAQSVIEILTDQYINITSKLNLSQVPQQNIINDTNSTDEEQILAFLESQFDKLFQTLNTITPDENEKFNQTINNYINYNIKKISNEKEKVEIPQVSQETLHELLAPYKIITNDTNDNTNVANDNTKKPLAMHFKGIIKNIPKNTNEQLTIVNNHQTNNKKHIVVNNKQKTENADVKKTKPKYIVVNNFKSSDINNTFDDLLKLNNEKTNINSNLTKQTRQQTKLISNNKLSNIALEKTNDYHKELKDILVELSKQRDIVSKLMTIKQKELEMMIRANEMSGRRIDANESRNNKLEPINLNKSEKLEKITGTKNSLISDNKIKPRK